MTLPSDLDIFRPSPSTKKPCVITLLYGGAPRVPTDSSSED